MRYTIKSHPTQYAGVLFRSRLEARWAAFFDLCKWKWEYEPIDFADWTPDFFLRIPCGHSECNKTHDVYVEVKPYRYVSEFNTHACLRYAGMDAAPPHADSVALLGISPECAQIPDLSHGAGGGDFDLRFFVSIDGNCGPYHGSVSEMLWNEAGVSVQWRPR